MKDIDKDEAEEYVDTLLNKDDAELDKFLDEYLGDLKLNKKQAGAILGIIKGVGISSYVIEDWWKKIAGENWKASAFHNPAAYNYCLNHQSEYSNHSVSVNWVLYGKIGGLGYLVNVNELDLPKDYKPEEDYVFVLKE